MTEASHTATDCADEVYKRIAEATGEFLCVKKRDGTQALKCQRPCDCCWDLGACEDYLFAQGRVGEPGKLDI